MQATRLPKGATRLIRAAPSRQKGNALWDAHSVQERTHNGPNTNNHCGR